MLGQRLFRLCRYAAKASQQATGTSPSLAVEAAMFGRLGATQTASMATNSHDLFNIHRNAPDNNLDTSFDFTDDNYERAAEIMSHYPSNYKTSAVIPLLTLAQTQNQGWLPLAAMNKVAEILGMPPIRVYEVATFYTMFNRSKMGKYHVMVCGTTPCMLCGARSIYQAIKDHLGIDYGQTTPDGYFTFSEMECMGSCVNAPMIAVADYTKGVAGFSYDYYEDLSPSDALKILDDLKAGKKPQKGSQHRNKAEPAGSVSTGNWVPKAEGQTTLSFESLGGKPPGPFCRNIDEEAQPNEGGQSPGPTPPDSKSPPPPPPKTPPRG